uniref:Uncharacterized protein n=1 Tax=Arundo donax TaxID=35708 RepID=A0A0A9AY44_ARUDO
MMCTWNLHYMQPKSGRKKKPPIFNTRQQKDPTR